MHNKRILRARGGLVVVGTVTYSEVGVSSPQVRQPLCGPADEGDHHPLRVGGKPRAFGAEQGQGAPAEEDRNEKRALQTANWELKIED